MAVASSEDFTLLPDDRGFMQGMAAISPDSSAELESPRQRLQIAEGNDTIRREKANIRKANWTNQALRKERLFYLGNSIKLFYWCIRNGRLGLLVSW
ncbi:hypothetical protein SUGI_0472790 [Cryptomeria japonica]|nr:hypothetical protein SUGI_0472790 [Cryptomeria japonica]